MDDSARPEPVATTPRFPWAAALLCAACVGAAGWTWMRYSYAWEADGGLLRELGRASTETEREAASWLMNRFVRVRGALLLRYPPNHAAFWADGVPEYRKLQVLARGRRMCLLVLPVISSCRVLP